MGRGVGCKVKFGKFKWNRGGYAEVMDEGGVQSMLDQQIGSPPEGCEVEKFRGKLATGRVMKTTTREAYERELRENSLLRRIS